MPKSAPIISTRINLNLLYPQGNLPKLPVRFFKWLLLYGRFVVIFVEIIVLACFALRFKLDADLNDLKEKINNQVPYLESLAVDEALTTQTQQRLALIKASYFQSDIWEKTLSHISQQTPQNTILSTLNLTNTDGSSELQIKLVGRTSNNTDIALFLKSLKSNKNFSEVSLTSVTFEQGELTYSLTGKAK